MVDLHDVMRRLAAPDQVLREREYDIAYVDVNSLFKNPTPSIKNRLDFSVQKGAQSLGSVIGTAVNPTEVVQLRISSINFGVKFSSNIAAASGELKFGELYVLIPQFMQESFASPYGYRYHFAFTVSQNPSDVTQLIAVPKNSHYTFPRPVTFNGNLSFDFFTAKQYQFESDVLECFVDYSRPFLTFYKTDGSQHGLSNLDIIYIDNFQVPGLISATDSTLQTHKTNQYRISVVDDYLFQIPIQLSPAVIQNINRPGDLSLGVYKQPAPAAVTFGNPTVLTTYIPHGLSSGSQIKINYTNNSILSLVGTFVVTVIDAITFSVPVNTSMIGGNDIAYIDSLPISTDRQYALTIKIMTKKVTFQLQIVSKSKTATTGLIFPA